MTEPTPIEFQLLQLVVSYVGNERITLGLLYWDGQRLRFFLNRERVPAWLNVDRQDLDRTLDAIERTVKPWVSQARAGGRLVEVAPVRPGEGSLLMWSPVQVGSTRFVEAHHRELLGLLYLVPPPSAVA